jgi:hypothetical protein
MKLSVLKYRKWKQTIQPRSYPLAYNSSDVQCHGADIVRGESEAPSRDLGPASVIDENTLWDWGHVHGLLLEWVKTPASIAILGLRNVCLYYSQAWHIYTCTQRTVYQEQIFNELNMRIAVSILWEKKFIVTLNSTSRSKYCPLYQSPLLVAPGCLRCLPQTP